MRENTNLPEHLPYQLIHVSSLLSLGVSRLFQARFGLGIREWRVLAILGYYGPSSAAELVGQAAFDKATVSRAIKRLVRQGHVRRGPHPNDARRRLIYLTEKGVALHDRVAPISRLRRRVIESALTEEERAALSVILEKLRRQLEWLNAEEQKDMAAAGRGRKGGKPAD
ncbi:MAG: MarR family winged helix-turn-helix transcriptional regulator [Rhodothalassiaceae bacterium]